MIEHRGLGGVSESELMPTESRLKSKKQALRHEFADRFSQRRQERRRGVVNENNKEELVFVEGSGSRNDVPKELKEQEAIDSDPSLVAAWNKGVVRPDKRWRKRCVALLGLRFYCATQTRAANRGRIPQRVSRGEDRASATPRRLVDWHDLIPDHSSLWERYGESSDSKFNFMKLVMKEMKVTDFLTQYEEYVVARRWQKSLAGPVSRAHTGPTTASCSTTHRATSSVMCAPCTRPRHARATHSAPGTATRVGRRKRWKLRPASTCAAQAPSPILLTTTASWCR